jgi:hypothetical protein
VEKEVKLVGIDVHRDRPPGAHHGPAGDLDAILHGNLERLLGL